MLVKVHIAGGVKIISIADNNIIGKEFEEGDKYIKVSEHFYKGEKKSEREILVILEDASSANIVGKKSIDLALRNKIIEKENILEIDGVPFAIAIFHAK